MHYHQDVSACLSSVSEQAFNDTLKDAAAALTWLRAEVDGGDLAAFQVCRETSDLSDLQTLAIGFRQRCDTVAVLGTGGSSLGGQALCALSADETAPDVRFFDNVDPTTLDAAFVGTAPERIGLVIISKSGGTAETLAQALTLVPQLAEKAGDRLKERVVVITEPGDTPLRRFAAGRDFAIRDHDPGIEGRYAVFSLVGLLPALIAGVDAAAVRAGAAATLSQALTAAGAADVPAAVGAALSVALNRERGVGISVLMPYSDQLTKFAQWYRQLWAESLGKDGKGTTPVEALGTVDQHSQLQLYLDGPADKMFTIVAPDHAGTGATIDAGLAAELGLDYLAGRAVGDLMAAEQRATIDSLVGEGCPTRVLSVERVDAATVGALMMHYMLESVIAARLFAVNPFDQPAVEDSKVRARAYLRAAK
jgi:glucose-6-phosphate isomerase